MTLLSRKAFEAVTQLFHEASGIRLGDNKEALVAGRLQRLAQEHGVNDLEAYVDRLVSGNAPAAEMTRVIDRLTTNETYFFREPQHFNDLAERLQSHQGDDVGEFSVWSAASSSGEEAYSIAMLLADQLGDGPWQVWGTDLSTAMVDSARRGLYSMERARLVPADYLRRFCLKGQGQHKGDLLVSKALRQRVRFLPANLMAELPQLPMFDVIFLRNVLIYFDPPTKAEVVDRVLTQLKPGGLFFIGTAEGRVPCRTPLQPLGAGVFRKGAA